MVAVVNILILALVRPRLLQTPLLGLLVQMDLKITVHPVHLVPECPVSPRP